MRTHKSTIWIDTTVERKYRYSARQGKDTAAKWSHFISTCKALAADGFEYSTSITSQGGYIIVRIEGTAGRAIAKRKPTKRAFTMPSKLTPERCAKEVEAAKREALAGGMVVEPQRRGSVRWAYDLRTQAEDRKIGRLIAKAKARGDSQVDTSAVYGFTLAWGVTAAINERKRKSYDGMPPDPREARQARLSAMAEYKFWREMEALSGQRDKYRPGVADTLCADDELVGAAA